MKKLNTLQKPVTKKQEGQLGHMARYYDLMMPLMTFGREKELRQMTIRLAQLKPGDKVLEVGCGTGTLSLAAKAQVGPLGEVIGIDIAPEMIAVAGKKARKKGIDVSFQVGSIDDIPFSDNRFDEVICSFMIFHMPEDVRMKGLKEIYRVLKSGGHLFVLDLTLPDIPWQRRFVQMHFGHMMQHDVRELVPVLKDNSFTEIEAGNAKLMGNYYVRGEPVKR